MKYIQKPNGWWLLGILWICTVVVWLLIHMITFGAIDAISLWIDGIDWIDWKIRKFREN